MIEKELKKTFEAFKKEIEDSFADKTPDQILSEIAEETHELSIQLREMGKKFSVLAAKLKVIECPLANLVENLLFNMSCYFKNLETLTEMQSTADMQSKINSTKH